MKRFEEELRRALRRGEPPEGFTGRVLAAAAEEKRSAWSRFFAWPALRWATVGAVCLMLTVAGIEYKRARDEQARGEAAKAQVMLALRITAGKLQLVQEKVQQLDGSHGY